MQGQEIVLAPNGAEMPEIGGDRAPRMTKIFRNRVVAVYDDKVIG